MRLSIDKISYNLLYLLFFSLPLVFLPFIFNPYESAKFVLFVAFSLLLGMFYFLNKGKISFDFLTKLILVYGLVVLVSDIFGIDLRNSLLGSGYRFQGFITLFCGILIYLFARNLKNKSGVIKKTELAIILSACLVCIISLLQAISLYILKDLNIPNYQGRIVGTIGNPNSLGGYLCMVLPLLLFNKRINSVLKVFAALMILSVIFLTQSRGAILAGISVFVIYGISYVKRFRFWKTILTIIFSIALILFVVNVNRGSIWDNRNLIWSYGLKAIVNRPILGYGQENFNYIFPKERKIIVDNAHNLFLETAVSSGIVGLLLYIAIIAYALKKTSRWDVRLSLLAFLIVGQFNPLSISQIALFWFLLGIGSNEGKKTIVT